MTNPFLRTCLDYSGDRVRWGLSCPGNPNPAPLVSPSTPGGPECTSDLPATCLRNPLEQETHVDSILLWDIKWNWIVGKPFPGWLSVLRWLLPRCAHHSPPSLQGVLGGGSLLPPSSTPAHSPTLGQSRRKLGGSRGHALLPRMTEGKHEEVLGGMGLFQKGVLNLRFDGKALRDGQR